MAELAPEQDAATLCSSVWWRATRILLSCWQREASRGRRSSPLYPGTLDAMLAELNAVSREYLLGVATGKSQRGVWMR